MEVCLFVRPVDEDGIERPATAATELNGLRGVGMEESEMSGDERAGFKFSMRGRRDDELESLEGMMEAGDDFCLRMLFESPFVFAMFVDLFVVWLFCGCCWN